MKKLFKIEGIPRPGSIVYSAVVAKSPVMEDFYHMVAEEALSKVSSGRILDIGTGPGYLPLEIGQKSKDIDISPAMVEIAGWRIDGLSSNRDEEIAIPATITVYRPGSHPFLC